MIGPARPFLYAMAAFVGATVAAPPAALSPVLSDRTAAGWAAYVAATEQRIGREMKAAPRFLALDFAPSAEADRAAVRAGQMPVAQMQTARPGGKTIDVHDGWVHHWRGAVLIPQVTLDQVFARLQAEVPGSGQGDVLASSILARTGPGSMRVFIKVQRQGRFIVSYKLVYNTEHEVAFTRDGRRGSSTSVATKIAELDSPGTPGEREFPSGDQNGFLRRWNSYWRYEQVAEGVIAECESITLSRTAPFGTGWIAGHFADEEASAAMTRALINLRTHFAPPAPAAAPPK